MDIATGNKPAQGPTTVKTEPPKDVGDQTIREHLTAKLKAQPWAHLLANGIVISNGVVHLYGTVRTEDERRALRIAAKSVSGVRLVEDHLMPWIPLPT
jgi:osmotically-inducible protein OsmY